MEEGDHGPVYAGGFQKASRFFYRVSGKESSSANAFVQCLTSDLAGDSSVLF